MRSNVTTSQKDAIPRLRIGKPVFNSQSILNKASTNHLQFSILRDKLCATTVQQNATDSCWETVEMTTSFSKTKNGKCGRVIPPAKIHKGTPLPKETYPATYKISGKQKRWSENRKVKPINTGSTKNLKVLHEHEEEQQRSAYIDKDFEDARNSTICRGGVSICKAQISGFSPIKSTVPKGKPQKVVVPLKHYLVETLRSPDSSQSKVEKWLVSTEKHVRKKDFTHLAASPIPFDTLQEIEISGKDDSQKVIPAEDENRSLSEIDSDIDDNSHHHSGSVVDGERACDMNQGNKDVPVQNKDTVAEEFSPIPSEYNDMYEDENSLESCIMSEIISIRKWNKMKTRKGSIIKDTAKTRKKRKRITMKIYPKRNAKSTVAKKNARAAGKKLAVPAIVKKGHNITLKNGSLCFHKKGYNLRCCGKPMKDASGNVITHGKSSEIIDEDNILPLTKPNTPLMLNKKDAPLATDETPPNEENIESGKRKLSFQVRKRLPITDCNTLSEDATRVHSITCCLVSENSEVQDKYIAKRLLSRYSSEESFPSDCLSI